MGLAAVLISLLAVIVCVHGLETQPNWPIKQVHVVNLERRPDRLENVRRQLEYLKIPFERFNAVDGRNLEAVLTHYKNTGEVIHLDYVDKRWEHDYDWMLRARPNLKRSTAFCVLGCMMSHFHTQLKAIDNVQSGRVEDGPVLIFEDDVSIDAEFVERVADLIETLTEEVPDWGMFHLGYTMNHRGSPLHSNKDIVEHKSGWGAQGYVMRSVKYSQMMVDRANGLDSFVHNDCLWHELKKRNMMKVFVYAPNTLVVQNQREYGSNLLGYWRGADLQRVRTPIVLE